MVEPTKKCPYCYARVLTDATKCPECDNKIGAPDKFNMAKKPFDWMAYLLAIIALGALGWFCFWLFIQKG